MRFFTDAGIEVPAVTANQMREIDRIAVEETGPNLFQMMENAGRSLALQALEVLERDWEKAKIVVLAGSGGNGGGGICAARHLANRGADTTLCLANPSRLREIPAYQRQIFQSTAGKETGVGDLRDVPADLIVDALIGYGLESAPRGAAVAAIRWANNANAPVLSLDVPSGVEATSGQTAGEFIKPQWTMTLALPKTGLLPDNCGELVLADIGIPEAVYRRMGLDYEPPFAHQFRARLEFHIPQ